MNLRTNTHFESNIDPINPMDMGIVAVGQVGNSGIAIGLMGLTYSKQEIDYINLKYKTNEGKIVSVKLQ